MIDKIAFCSCISNFTGVKLNLTQVKFIFIQ